MRCAAMKSARWRRPSAEECYADLLLELHAYFAFSMLALVALHIGNALHDDMMRASGDGATRKN
jgi:cytochrome b561